MNPKGLSVESDGARAHQKAGGAGSRKQNVTAQEARGGETSPSRSRAAWEPAGR